MVVSPSGNVASVSLILIKYKYSMEGSILSCLSLPCFLDNLHQEVRNRASRVARHPAVVTFSVFCHFFPLYICFFVGAASDSVFVVIFHFPSVPVQLPISGNVRIITTRRIPSFLSELSPLYACFCCQWGQPNIYFFQYWLNIPSLPP
jgi:hypothetical protein